ncbi:MAG: aromatic amino acid ammonia-lyase [Pseudomonadota bacterium]
MIKLRHDRDLTLDAFRRIVLDHAPVSIDPETERTLDQAFEIFSSRPPETAVYGLNTGLGPMVTVPVADAALETQQLNLIRSHAAGMGDPVPPQEARAILLARAQSLSRNRSAVRAALPRLMCDWLNAGLAPVVPRHGGVGASGDLVQLAHLGLGLIGEGRVYAGNAITDAPGALRAAGLAPHTLAFRDGLAIINGVSAMTGVGLTVVMDAAACLERALTLTALLAEITGLGTEPYSADLAAAKRHTGHHTVASALRTRLVGSDALNRDAGRPLQEYYSIRCAPQIFGALYDTIETARGVVVAELNSVSDNPVFDPQNETIVHGGNFHGEPVAMAMDQLKAAMVKLTMVAERQINFLLNDDVNKILPAFLNAATPGVTFGLQGAQFTAVSTTAASQSIGYPMALHSIPSNKDNQDVVSMGFDAAWFAREATANAGGVQAVLALAVQSAVDTLELKHALAPATREFLDAFPAQSVTHGHGEAIADVLENYRAILDRLR